MGVIVGGVDPDPVARERQARPLTALVVACVALAGLAVASYPGPSSPIASTEALGGIASVDSGRWLPLSDSAIAPFNSQRLNALYLMPVVGGVSTIDRSGNTTTVMLPGVDVLRGIASDGERAVAFGTSDRSPALWTSVDGHSWDLALLPWTGAVQAVVINESGLLVIGFDTTLGRQVLARSSGERGATWMVEESNGPQSVLLSAGDAFVGRAAIEGTIGYVQSFDGINWEPFGEVIVNNVGDVAAIVHEGGASHLRIPGEERAIRPPEWPVSAVWRVEDRIWLQTPTAAWWSRDGMRWTRLPLDRAHGIDRGLPVLLPFEDRALVSVGGTRGEPRDIYMWILGA
jgi:hypothetical protein